MPFIDARGVLLTAGTTGLCSWPAAWCLAEFAYQNKKLFEKSILELGAGIGLGGIILASSIKLEEPVYLTDVHSGVLQMAERNAKAANHIIGIKAEVRELDWCSFDEDELRCLLENTDCIVGADIFFEPALFQGRVMNREPRSFFRNFFVILMLFSVCW